jgi:hypothetical protein
MVTFELVEFIKSHLYRNTPREQVRGLLKNKGGWVDEDIDHAFLLAEHGKHVEEYYQ